MKNLVIIAVLSAILAMSGCVAGQKSNQIAQTGVEKNAGQNNTSIEKPAEVPTKNESSENISLMPQLANEIQVGPGRSSSLASLGGKLYVAYQRFTGSSEDIYYTAYDGNKFEMPKSAAASELNEMWPSITSFNGKIYLFYTKAIEGSAFSNIYFRYFAGNTWSGEAKADDINDLYYPHNQSAIPYGNKLLFFWTRGAPGQTGAIGAQYYNEDSWIDAMKVSAETVNEKNPKINASNEKIYLLFEGYNQDAATDETYIRTYNGFDWGSAEKLSNSIKADIKSAGGVAYFRGKLYALWYASGKLYLSIKTGNSWSEPILLTEGAFSEEEPSIAEYNGKLYASFTRIQTNGAPFVYLAELKI